MLLPGAIGSVKVDLALEKAPERAESWWREHLPELIQPSPAGDSTSDVKIAAGRLLTLSPEDSRLAQLPHFVFSPNTLLSVIGLIRGRDMVTAAPAEDWRDAKGRSHHPGAQRAREHHPLPCIRLAADDPSTQDRRRGRRELRRDCRAGLGLLRVSWTRRPRRQAPGFDWEDAHAQGSGSFCASIRA
jgi:hypothetical protein